jgi:hypothetical protein
VPLSSALTGNMLTIDETVKTRISNKATLLFMRIHALLGFSAVKAFLSRFLDQA